MLSHRRKVFPADLSIPADVHLLEDLFDFACYVADLAVPVTPLVPLMPMPAAGGRTEAEVVLADVPLYNSKKLFWRFGAEDVMERSNNQGKGDPTRGVV